MCDVDIAIKLLDQNVLSNLIAVDESVVEAEFEDEFPVSVVSIVSCGSQVAHLNCAWIWLLLSSLASASGARTLREYGRWVSILEEAYVVVERRSKPLSCDFR